MNYMHFLIVSFVSNGIDRVLLVRVS